jgi:hypothetical protein
MDVAALPDPGPYAGRVFSVRQAIFLPSRYGIPSETVHPGDIIASDGRIWYHVTRSDSPGRNSFYPNAMEIEIFRMAINDNMLKAGSVFTTTFEFGLQMFKHDTNVQYLLVVEIAELPETTDPAITGPNLFAVAWNKTPLLQQRIIVTDVKIVHKFGAQVLKSKNGILATNKKIYGVEVAGDVIPETANFAIRARLIEFDTEDNVNDAMGLIFYTLEKGTASVSRQMPTVPVVAP